MPYGYLCAHEDLAYDCGVGRQEDSIFVDGLVIVEVHYVAVATECLAVLFGSLQALGGEQPTHLLQSFGQHRIKTNK